MCLNLNINAKKHKAKSDLVCYKIARKDSINSRLVTYFQMAKISIGKTYTSELFRYSVADRFNNKRSAYVDFGLHSFKTYEQALMFYTDRDYVVGICLIKCVIPKGAWYYEGLFSTYDSYASSNLRYDEIVFDRNKI